MDGDSLGIELGTADTEGCIEGCDDGFVDKLGFSDGWLLGLALMDGDSLGCDVGQFETDGFSDGCVSTVW